MPFRIKCPRCQAIAQVPDESRGKKARCAKCSGVIAIPMLRASAPPTKAPASVPLVVIPPNYQKAKEVYLPTWVVPAAAGGGLLVLGIVIGMLLSNFRPSQPEAVGQQPKASTSFSRIAVQMDSAQKEVKTPKHESRGTAGATNPSETRAKPIGDQKKPSQYQGEPARPITSALNGPASSSPAVPPPLLPAPQVTPVVRDMPRAAQYARDMRQAFEALNAENHALAGELLGRYQPKSGEADVRAWE